MSVPTTIKGNKSLYSGLVDCCEKKAFQLLGGSLHDKARASIIQGKIKKARKLQAKGRLSESVSLLKYAAEKV